MKNIDKKFLIERKKSRKSTIIRKLIYLESDYEKIKILHEFSFDMLKLLNYD